ncbi:ADP-ribosylglycohydrolase family protein [Pedobacter sp.]
MFSTLYLTTEFRESYYAQTQNLLGNVAISATEIALFDRLLKQDINDLKEECIFSSGYVLHTLEASIWYMLTTDNYKDAVLKAVNLGEDKDTTGALAGLLYGLDSIPTNWLTQIARYKDIEELSERLAEHLASKLQRTLKH